MNQGIVLGAIVLLLAASGLKGCRSPELAGDTPSEINAYTTAMRVRINGLTSV